MKYFRFWLGVVSLCLIFSCSTQQEQASNPLLFKEFITSFSSGQISYTAPISVYFSQKIPEKKTQLSASELFSISPKVKGSLSFSGNRLTFTPEEHLKSDTEYFITLHLSKLFDVKQKELQNFHFKVNTPALKFNVTSVAVKSPSKDFYSWEGLFSSSDEILAEQIPELVLADIDGMIRVNLKVSALQKNSFAITVDSIKKSDEIQGLNIRWNGEKIGSSSQGVLSEILPAKNDYRVINIYKKLGEENFFTVNFSFPLLKNQDFRGLVQISDYTGNLNFTPEGSQLKVFLDTPFLQEKATVIIREGIKGTHAERTQEEYTQKIDLKQVTPQIRWISSGNILPSSENLKINFQAIGLKAVRVTVSRIYQNNILQFLQENSLSSTYGMERVGAPIAQKIIPIAPEIGKQAWYSWGSYAIDLSKLITPDPGAIYQVKINIDKNFSAVCGDSSPIAEQNIPIQENTENQDDEYDYYNYNWEERDNPCKDSYYYGKAIKTNVLASDLGVIVKKERDNNYLIAVNDLLSTQPVNAATVEWFDYQQQKIGESVTDSDGIAYAKTPKKAAFAVVRKDKNTSYLALENGRSLSVSRYDVDGVRLQEGRNGFIYTERGVWRPGDSIRVGFILNDFTNKLPENHPIKLTFSDPYGKIIQEQVQASTPSNHYLFKLKTQPDAPTGNWNCKISVGASSFSRNIKVETIKPNRLKIINNLENRTISQSGAQGKLQINWLQGTPAGNTQVQVSAKMSAAPTTFKGFEGYTFSNTSLDFETEETSIFNGKTNAEGEAVFLFKPKENLNASSMLRAIFLTKADETGGDFSTDVCSATYSPFASYAGIQAPEPNPYGYYSTGKNHLFKIAVVSEYGKPLAHKKVKVFIYRDTYSWWWRVSERNLSAFTSANAKEAAYKADLETDSNGIAQLNINIDNEDYGNYFILVQNTESKHEAGISAFFDWSAHPRHGEDSEATMLAISTDKKEYSVSENITLAFPSEKGARALISIENGSKVLQTYQVETQAEQTQFSLRATAEMAPNAYAYVTLLQPHSQTVNNAPIRLYGIAPFAVSDPNTKLQPIISSSEVLRPKKDAIIKVSEKSGVPMQYTLAIVEEGLLDLTRFKTPNPWGRFFSKTALGVKTWDLYNEVIGAYGGTLNQVFSIGGDEDLGAAQAQKANRFKPFVSVLGPFSSNGKEQTHKIRIPDYVGSARVMVVASNVAKNAYGSAEKTVSVRSPLMVLASAPRKAAPSETITLPVTVFATQKGMKNAWVKVKTSENISILGADTQNVSFTENPQEKMAFFSLKVNHTGIGKIWVEAGAGAEKASYEVEMQLYNPNPRSFVTQTAVIEPNSTKDIAFHIFGEQPSTTLEVSSFPGVNLAYRIQYLMEYPHGCAEQIASQGFAQLFLNDLANLSAEQTEKVQQRISQAIAKLSENQLQNGGFSYWKSGKYPDEWVTSYVGEFYLEAEKKGFSLPIGSKKIWLSFQRNQARNWQNNHAGADFNQAYRLYTLALANQADIASMNRLRETQNLSNQALTLLSGAYALAGQKKTANQLFAKVRFDASDPEDYYGYGSPTRNQAMALQVALLLNQKQAQWELAQKISEKLSINQWLSTQTTAYALQAMAKFISENKSGKQWAMAYTLGKNKKQIQSETGFASASISAEKGSHSLHLQNLSQQSLYAKIISSGIPPIGEEFAQQNGLHISTQFTDNKGNTISVENMQQSTSFLCKIKVKNTTQNAIENIALTQFLCSGWEMINTRFTEYESSQEVDYSDIRDDRVNFYFGLKPEEEKHFEIHINASYQGDYYLPGTQAEAMYNHQYQARTAGHWVKIW